MVNATKEFYSASVHGYTNKKVAQKAATIQLITSPNEGGYADHYVEQSQNLILALNQTRHKSPLEKVIDIYELAHDRSIVVENNR